MTGDELGWTGRSFETAPDTGDTLGNTPEPAPERPENGSNGADNADTPGDTPGDSSQELPVEGAEKSDDGDTEPAGPLAGAAPRMSDCPSPLGTVCKDPACPLHFPQNQPSTAGDGDDPPLERRRVGHDYADPAAPPLVLDDQGNRVYDWQAIKKRYVEGVKTSEAGVHEWPSLDQVAAHFGVRPNRVREKSAQEGWVEARRKWQQQVEQVRQQARAAALAKEAVNLDGRALDAAKMGLQLCITRLAELGQLAQHRRQQSVGSGVADSRLDAQEQQRLAAAVDLWHKVGLRAIGDPETHRVEITGANGAPIEIATELKRDDPERITGVLAVLAQAGLGNLFGRADVEGEVVDGDPADGSPAALRARR